MKTYISPKYYSSIYYMKKKIIVNKNIKLKIKNSKSHEFTTRYLITHSMIYPNTLYHGMCY